MIMHIGNVTMHKTWRVSRFSLLLAVAACGAEISPLASTPASEPTHHAIVEGIVIGAADQPLTGVQVGVRFASTTRGDGVSAIGGGTTDDAGRYRFEARTLPPRAPDGTAKAYVIAFRYGAPGGQVMQDSILVTLQLVALREAAGVTRVAPLRLPAP
jgi:hypothetical protein